MQDSMEQVLQVQDANTFTNSLNKLAVPKCIFLFEGFLSCSNVCYFQLFKSFLNIFYFYLLSSSCEKNQTTKSNRKAFKKQNCYYSLFPVLSKENLSPKETIALSMWYGFVVWDYVVQWYSYVNQECIQGGKILSDCTLYNLRQESSGGN